MVAVRLQYSKAVLSGCGSRSLPVKHSICPSHARAKRDGALSPTAESPGLALKQRLPHWSCRFTGGSGSDGGETSYSPCHCSKSLITIQESPHEHQQSLLLSRIITNVVRAMINVPAIEAYERTGEAQRSRDGSQQEFTSALSLSLWVCRRAHAHLDRGVQEINIQNMNVELVAQMFKNYRSNVLFHLEGKNGFWAHG